MQSCRRLKEETQGVRNGLLDYLKLDSAPIYYLRATAYVKWLEDSVSDTEWEHIRKATQQGRVVGRESFQEEIGSKVGRRLIEERRGQPKGVTRSEMVLTPASLFFLRQ